MHKTVLSPNEISKRLRGAGLSRTYNLAGGILAWARDVDPGLQL